MQIYTKQGSSLVWKNSGGDYAITLASLPAGDGRCGVTADLADLVDPGGGEFPTRVLVIAEFNLDVAPIAGTTIELYWAPSADNTLFPGGATGTDADYMDGEEDEWKKQLQFIGALVATNDAHEVVQTQMFVFEPIARYGCPVVINKTDQAFEGDEDSHQLSLVGLVDEVQ